MIVRLSSQRFFFLPTVVNGRRVPLDMMDSKTKRKYIENICSYNFFTYLNYMEKKVK